MHSKHPDCKEILDEFQFGLLLVIYSVNMMNSYCASHENSLIFKETARERNVIYFGMSK